jgi:hypothetical protein
VSILSTSPQASDRRLTILTVTSVVFAVAMVVGGIIGLPRIISSADTTAQLERANDLQSCRASFRTQVDDADALLAQARAELDVLTNAGLEASVRDDDAALLRIVAELQPARELVTTRSVELQAAVTTYQRRVALSRDDPKAFLRECHTAA